MEDIKLSLPIQQSRLVA